MRSQTNFLGYLLHRLADKFRRLRSVDLFSLTLGILTLFSFTFISVAPVIRTSDGSVDLLRIRTKWQYCLVFLICSSYLKYKDPVQRWFSRGTTRTWRRRHLEFAAVISRLEAKLIRNEAELLRLREDILRCTSDSVADHLGLPATDLCANLIVFEEDTDHMCCVARSDRSRDKPRKIYDFSDWYYPGLAVRENQTRVVDDTRRDPAWRDSQPPPNYRSVLYFPLSRQGQRLGTVTVDSIDGYVFVGRKDELDNLVRPLLATLCLTFPPNALSLN